MKQKVCHPGKRYEYEQCVDAVPDGFPSLGHGAEYCRIGSARKFSSSTFSLSLACVRAKGVALCSASTTQTGAGLGEMAAV
jgi:hypothetical protein